MSYAGDESNACDTDLESEPGDLEEDDEPPTEESPPEQSDKQPKRRRTDTSPVASSSDAVRYHGCGQVASRGQNSPRASLSLSAGHTPVLRKSVPTQPRALNVGAKRGLDDKETLSAALGNITNMLSKDWIRQNRSLNLWNVSLTPLPHPALGQELMLRGKFQLLLG